MKSLVAILQALPLVLLAIITAGLALFPAFYCFNFLYNASADLVPFLRFLALGLSAALCYYVYGFALILVAPLLNFLLRANLKPFRGPAVSLGALNWYIHNSIVFVVRYSFLEFVTPTEFCVLYYRLMGMKIGRNVHINSTAIADPSLIQLEDRVTVGGSASITAHYSQGGYVVIEPTIVRKGATIGLRAILMGGVEVGENSKILANSFVLPKTKIPANETWGGIPAVKLDMKKIRQAAEQNSDSN